MPSGRCSFPVAMAVGLICGCPASSQKTNRDATALRTAVPAPAADLAWRHLTGERSSALRAFALLDDERGATFAVVGPQAGQPLGDVLHADVRAWALDADRSPRRLPNEAVSLPLSARELTLGSIDGRVLFAATNDDSTPGFVVEYEGSGTERPVLVAPLALSENERARVAVPFGREWSTRTLPCSEWLFAPRVQPVPLAGAPVVTFGTVDGQTAMFRYDRSRRRAEPLALIPRAVDAVLLSRSSGAGVRVYHRVPDVDWSGYADSQNAWSRGPVALPIRVLEIDASGAVSQPARVVHPTIGDDPVLAFDAARARDGALVMAVVRGDIHHPGVAIFRIDESGGIAAFPPIELGAMPVALRLVVTRDAVFAAILTRSELRPPRGSVRGASSLTLKRRRYAAAQRSRPADFAW